MKYLPALQRIDLDHYYDPVMLDLLDKHTVKSLCIRFTDGKTRDLYPLVKFKDTLEELTIEGTFKKVPETITEFRSLKKLSLVSVKLKDLDFLKEIPLLSFCNYGSRIADQTAIGEIRSLEFLRMKMDTKIEDISFISRMFSLKTIDISWCSHIRVIPDLSGLKKLEKIQFVDCNGVEDLGNLKSLSQPKIWVSGKKIGYYTQNQDEDD